MMNVKCRNHNKDGFSTPMVAVLVLMVSMILSVAIFFATTEIQAMAVRNAVKTELANLSIRISYETYAALREGNFEEYLNTLIESGAKKNELVSRFKRELSSAIELSNENYDVKSIDLVFTCDGNRLVYTCNCDISFRVNVLGSVFPPVERSVSVTGSHTAKY